MTWSRSAKKGAPRNPDSAARARPTVGLVGGASGASHERGGGRPRYRVCRRGRAVPGLRRDAEGLQEPLAAGDHPGGRSVSSHRDAQAMQRGFYASAPERQRTGPAGRATPHGREAPFRGRSALSRLQRLKKMPIRQCPTGSRPPKNVLVLLRSKGSDSFDSPLPQCYPGPSLIPGGIKWPAFPDSRFPASPSM
jgi:hypothetical protein